MKKRIVSTLLALAMCLSLLPTAALAGRPTGIYYIDEQGEKQTLEEFTALNGETTSLESGFYAVDYDYTLNSVSVASGAKLILSAGNSLTIGSLTGTEGSLSIYGGKYAGSLADDDINSGTCSINSISGVTVTLYGGTYTSLPESGWALGESFCFRTENESEEDEGEEGIAYTYSTVFSEGATVVYCPDVDEGNEKYHKYADPYTDGKCLNCGHECDHNWPPVTGTRSLDDYGKCSYCHWQYPVRIVDYIGTTEETTVYSWLDDFDPNVEENTPTLFADIGNVQLAYRKNYTLDLNGFTLTQINGDYVNGENVVIQDSKGTGKIVGLFKITGGTVQLHAGVTLADGIKTTVSGATLADYLAPGTAYEQNGAVVNAYTETELTGPVKVVAHTHSFTGGTCDCGASDTGCKTEGCTGSYNKDGFCSANNGHYQAATLNDDVYEIANAGQLYWFASAVNSGSTSINARLTDNITINSGVLKDDGTLNNANSASFRQWTPIGNSSYKYTGTFDGNNKTISGLYYSGDAEYVGPFGYVDNGTVKDVTLKDSYLYSESSSDISVGGIAGRTNKGTITHCTVNATVRGKNTGSSSTTYIGGIAGRSSGSISFCANFGVVSGECTQRHAYVGGIVGFKSLSSSALTNCYNTGDISGDTPNSNRTSIGGVVGSNDNGSIINCYSVGTVSSTKENSNVGGVAGYIPYGSISNCYWQKAEDDTISGIGNKSTDGTADVESKTADEFASGEVAWLLNGSTATPETGNTLAWYQKLTGTDADAAPTLDSSRGTVYHGYAVGGCTETYSNTALSADPTHSWDSDGKCTVCTATCEHKSVGTDNKCTVCKMQMKVEGKNDENEIAYYPSVDAAVQDSHFNMKLLADDDTTLQCDAITCSIDLNGHKLAGIDASYLSTEGSVTITDSVGGGSIGTINGANRVTLPDGYALQKTDDNSMVKRSEFGTTLENVKVVKCTAHSVASGMCEYCNTVFVAKVTHGGTDSYFATFNEAYTAAQSGDTITLLADATYQRMSNSTNDDWYKSFILKLNGHKLSFKSKEGYKTSQDIEDASVTIEGPGSLDGIAAAQGYNGSTLTLKGAVTCERVEVRNKATLYVSDSSVHVKELNVRVNANVALSAGTYDKVMCVDDKGQKKIGDLLASGYAFKTTDGTWYDQYNNSDATEIKNVTVTAAPITRVELTADNESYTYGDTVGVTATVTVPQATTESIDYRWYLNDAASVSGTHDSGTTITGNWNKLIVRSHTFRIEVTIDGYTRTSEAITVTVNKAEITDYNAPKAKAGLAYNGNSQKLIDMNYGFQSDYGEAKFMFRLGADGTWSADLPTATDTGKYTIDWYIDGGDNYNNVGSEASPAGSVNVTIGRKTVEHPSIVFGNNNQMSYTYTGSPIKPAFALMDGNTVIPESEYTVSYYDNTNVCNNAQMTVTCKDGGNYNFVEVTRAFEITKADQTITVPVDKTIPKNNVGVDISTWATATGVIANDATVGALTYTLDEEMTGVSLENNKLTADFNVSVGAEISVKVTAAATGNYNEASATFTVRVTELPKATGTTPSVNTLTYNGTEQALVTAGTATGGTMQYRLGVNGSFSTEIPKAKDAGEYTVFYKVVGDEEHSDSDVSSVRVVIDPETLTKADLEYTGAAITKEHDGTDNCDLASVSVKAASMCNGETPLTISGTAVYDSPNVYEAKKVTFTPDAITTGNYRLAATEKLDIPATITSKKVTPSVSVASGSAYNGKEQKPAVTVTVNGNGLTDLDYTVSYEDNIQVGTTAKAIVTAKENRNYTWEPVTENFSIEKAAAPTGVTATPTEIIYTQTPYTVDLSTAITGMPMDAGNVSYSDPNNGALFNINGNILTLNDTITYKIGQSVTVYVLVSSDNYKDARVEVTIRLLDKTPKNLTVTMTGWTYGDTAKTPQYTKPDGMTTETVQYKAQGTEDDTYTTDVPTNAGKYTVKVSCETTTERYTGTADFAIARKDIAGAVIELNVVSSDYLTYNGNEKSRTVESVSVDGKTLTEDDYTVSGDLSGTYVQNYTITVTGAGNYTGTANTTWTIGKKTIYASTPVAEKEYDGTTTATVTVNFDTQAAQAALVTGDSIEVTGLIGTFDNANVGTGKTVTIDSSNAVVSGKNSGNYEIIYPSRMSTGVITPKPVTATVTVTEKTYDGTTTATVTATVENGLIAGDSITITGLTGTFDNANVGTGKDVTINADGKNITGNGSGNYDVTIPATAKGTIKAAKAIVITAPKANTLTYTGGAQALVTAGEASGGTMQYSLNQTDWSATIPTGKNVDTYTVWYKVVGDENHNDSAPASVSVTVAQGTPTVENVTATVTYGDAVKNSDIKGTSSAPGTFAWRSDVTAYGDAGTKMFHATFTPSDTTNYKAVENIEVSVTVNKAELPAAEYPDGLSGYAGNKLSSVTLPTGWSWNDGDTKLSKSGSFTASYAGDANHNAKSNVSLTVTVSAKERKDLSVSIDGWTYGDEPNAPTFTKPEGVVAEVLYSKNFTGTPTAEVPSNAGTYAVAVKYETDTETWIGGTTLTIAKATPTGAPKYTAITTSGKTLADAVITTEGGTFSVPGTVKWVDADGNDLAATSTVEANTAYKWLFTPTDSDNYNTISGEITLWHRSTSSGGGSSSAGTTVTVPVSSDHASVEVKAEVSKGNATVEVSDKQIEKVAADGAGNVTLDVSDLKNVESATVPSHVVEKTNEAEDTGLTVALPTGSVTLDETALESVTENANGKDVTISVEAVSVSKLPTVVKKLIGMDASVVAVVDVNVTISGKKQSSFDGGKITVSIPYTPKAGEDTSKLTVWFVKDDGTIENKGGYYDAKNKCFVFETDHLSQYLLVNTNEKAGFTDVPADAYFASSVSWAAEKGITGGTTETTFSPYQPCTRAQIVTFLWRAAGQPEPKAMSTFSDVPANAYYAKAVAWAVENGITGGMGDGRFAPDQTCTRAQAVAFLFRYAAINGMKAVTLQELVGGYSDAASVPGYALSAFNWALAGGIVTGNNGALMPNTSCTRAQIVTFLYRLLGE